MNNEKQPEPLSAVWGDHIKRWQKTTLSQSAYCHEKNLSYHQFTYWRRKLFSQAKQRRKPVSHSAFVPIQSSTPLTVQGLSLTLSNGMTLQGITSSNLQVVKQLLSLLP